MYAFVDATDISGPAQMYSTSSASLARLEPTTLVSARRRAPWGRGRRGAGRGAGGSPGRAGGGQGVGRLSGLADGQGQGPLPDQGVAVAEFVGVGDFGGYAGQPLEQDPPHQAGVVGGAAGGYPDPGNLARVTLHPGQAVERHLVLHAGSERPADHFGLLVDLLEHEVVEAALLHRGGVPLGGDGGALHGIAVDGLDRRPVAGHVGDLAVLDDQEPAGVVQHRGNVGGEEGLAPAEADDEGADHPGSHDAARLSGGHRDQRVRSRGPGDSVADRLLEVPVVVGGHEVGEHLGVGLRPELHPGGLQLVAQRPEVLDDPVVDHHEVTGGVAVRMGVAVGGNPVGGPAGVTDPGPSRQRSLLEATDQAVQLSFRLGDGDRSVVGDRHAGRVVPPVFETAQPPDQHLLGRPGSHVADDPTHERLQSASAAPPEHPDGTRTGEAFRAFPDAPNRSERSAPVLHGAQPRPSDRAVRLPRHIPQWSRMQALRSRSASWDSAGDSTPVRVL